MKAKPEPRLQALQDVMRTVLNAIILSFNEIRELQKDDLFELRVRGLLNIYEHVCDY